MDRVKINISNFKNPRFDTEKFSFTDKEEKSIVSELNKIEAIMPEKSEVIFSISKYENLFKGSLRIESHDIFTYGKNSSAIALFNMLRLRVEKNIMGRNQIHTQNTSDSLKISVPKKTKNNDLFPINLNLKPQDFLQIKKIKDTEKV
jgi:hypothetical protein